MVLEKKKEKKKLSFFFSFFFVFFTGAVQVISSFFVFIWPQEKNRERRAFGLERSCFWKSRFYSILESLFRLNIGFYELKIHIFTKIWK